MEDNTEQQQDSSNSQTVAEWLNNPAPDKMTQKPKTKKRKIVRAFFAALTVLGGLFVGFIIGGFINFGACWKSSCSPAELYAPVYIPIASLLITIPVAVKIMKD